MSASAAPVFLDRDGTLIVEKHYLKDPAGVVIELGVLEGLELLQSRGHPLVVLSNQSGIGRGMHTLEETQLVNQRVEQMLRRDGIEIAGWYVCPHVPEAACDCRKPAPGLALAASHDLRLGLAGCYVVGDKRSDLELADAIGGIGILVTTGHGRAVMEWAAGRAAPVFSGMLGAARYIVKRELEQT